MRERIRKRCTSDRKHFRWIEDPLGFIPTLGKVSYLACYAGVAELADAPDSKSGSLKECRFEPDRR